MTSDPEESVRLQGYGEMTLRTAITTMMLLAPRERADAAIFRVRDGVRLASSEIAELASNWGIEPTGDMRSPRLAPDQHWPGDRPRHGSRSPVAVAGGGVHARCAGGEAVVLRLGSQSRTIDTGKCRAMPPQQAALPDRPWTRPENRCNRALPRRWRPVRQAFRKTSTFGRMVGVAGFEPAPPAFRTNFSSRRPLN
ncbi:hypothetical protein ACVW0I_002451 [Bradyrhizobium sp. LM6.11]